MLRSLFQGRGSRLILAVIVAVVSLITYFSASVTNPVTGEQQHISITPEQEIGLGLQAVPEMEQQYGGESNDGQALARVNAVGSRVVANSAARNTPYEYVFHLLADPQTINAFALPGGQVFITEGLYRNLKTEGELAGVLGHEVGHVVGRHGAEQIAQQQLTQGLTGAAVLAAYDPNDPNTYRNAQFAMMVGQLINLRYSRNDESEADKLGVCLMNQAGYDPHEMISVMQILESLSQGNEPPEFFSTHPNPATRIQDIQQDIQNIAACPQ